MLNYTPLWNWKAYGAVDGVLLLPTPSNINALWNFGRVLGMVLGVQLVTGFLLSLHYVRDLELAFNSVVEISRDVQYGWWLRHFHANGASIFFICLYIHIGRGIYFKRYTLMPVWVSGVVILLLVIITSFLGYVLPWGQISFWGATVITNLLSVIPFKGELIVQWIWGGFRVGG